MLKKLAVRVEGLTTLLMHNGQLADPLNEHAKALKEVSSRREKTDADHVELGRLEFIGSLYVSDRGHPCIPGTNIEAMLVEAAKKIKKGPKAKAGIFVEDDPELIYDGPKDHKSLWADARFRDRRAVRVQKSRVMRTRPRFKTWALEFAVSYDDAIINPADVKRIVEVAGEQVGLGDWRGRFGRFKVAHAK